MRLRPGYSLLEVLIAVAIIALAAGMAVPGLLGGLEAREASGYFRTAEARLRALRMEAALDARAIQLEDADLNAALPPPGQGWSLAATGQLAISPAGRCLEGEVPVHLVLSAPGGRSWARLARGSECVLEPPPVQESGEGGVAVF
ncbi:hypothetical protein X907_0563 [Glycocaulis alkaliphilus]|uniref:Uncharacterized protein n=1 Tax=Glycocaulis alkaliphilus TaxID=1434191 RepID=A0A3T0E770_9PROT|nr:prepilin-type N-terminal cleavage/methylation domain-containing protein [Glycocaulis alkaliphilus]AZU03110.1 hypothetical protein X907_0563 [Glycocaulis alkaliphilus]GGB71074.1 hypothetical protein GCM10007417_08580 [Glycocaulis alkaliphilus]